MQKGFVNPTAAIDGNGDISLISLCIKTTVKWFRGARQKGSSGVGVLAPGSEASFQKLAVAFTLP